MANQAKTVSTFPTDAFEPAAEWLNITLEMTDPETGNDIVLVIKGAPLRSSNIADKKIIDDIQSDRKGFQAKLNKYARVTVQSGVSTRPDLAAFKL